MPYFDSLGWGSNFYNELGDGTQVDHWHPTQLGSDFQAVAATEFQSAALKNDGSLWFWGLNQPMPKKLGDDFTAVATVPGQTYGVQADGTLWEFNSNALAKPLSLGNNFVDVAAAGGFFAGNYSQVPSVNELLALQKDGTLWQKNNTISSIDSPTQLVMVGKDFSVIAAGLSHFLALKNDGSLWVWGDNREGQLGDGSRVSTSSPKQIMTGVKAIAAGGGTSAAILEDNTLWMWGNNAVGQLGDGTTQNSLKPKKVIDNVVKIALGAQHTLAIFDDGSLWSWGGETWRIADNDADQYAYRPYKIFERLGYALPQIENAVYDGKTDILNIQDVVVGREHYQIQLQLLDAQWFRLISYRLLEAKTQLQPATYNEISLLLDIPKIPFFGFKLKAQFVNQGNDLFYLKKVEFLPSN